MLSLLVFDASALVEYLLLTDTGINIATLLENPGNDVHIPMLADVEVASALRRILSDRTAPITETRANQAIDDLLDLPLTRHSHEYILKRAFAFRQNLSVYDAVYVALAEILAAKLVTADKAMSSAPLPRDIELLVF